LPVFNYIISIDPGPFWAGRYAYTTPGANPLDHSVFNFDVVNRTGQLADTAGITFSPVYHESSVFIAEDCTVGAGFHAGTAGNAAEGFAINQANSPGGAFLNAFSNAFAFVGC